MNNYVLMRDTLGNGNWEQIATTAGTQNTIVDPNFNNYPNGRWRVETVWNITCDPTRAIVNTSRSNIKSQLAGPTTGFNENAIETITFSPNPFIETTQINIRTRSGKVDCLFELYDETGRMVKTNRVTASKFILERGGLANGIYFYRLIDKETGSAQKGKLIVNQ